MLSFTYVVTDTERISASLLVSLTIDRVRPLFDDFTLSILLVFTYTEIIAS